MLLVLPGREPSTLVEMEKLLSLGGVSAPIERYTFWAGDFSNPELQPEVDVLAARAPTHIIAKSIGTVVAILAHHQRHARPAGALFLGVPLRRMQAESSVDLLRAYCRSIPTTVVQRTGDPTGSFTELTNDMSSCAGVELHELAGDSHDYSTSDAAAVVRDWWSSVRGSSAGS